MKWFEPTNAAAEIGDYPQFGEFARQAAVLRQDELALALAAQRAGGGKLGELLVARGLLRREAIDEILGQQAAWVARSLRGELAPARFPYPAFLSLCLPAYNEQANIVSTIDSARTILPHFVERFEIVVVDDGSRDATARLVSDASRRDSRVRLVRHEVNRGYGAAVTAGLRAAAGELLMFADSDGQFNFLDVARLLVQLHDRDFVIGYRRDRADSWRRKLNAWAWGWLVRAVLGFRVRDLDCALKLFRREVIERVELTAGGACVNAELMTQCVWGGLRFREVPVSHYPRRTGAATGANWRVILRAFRELPPLRRYRRPLPPPPRTPIRSDAA